MSRGRVLAAACAAVALAGFAASGLAQGPGADAGAAAPTAPSPTVKITITTVPTPKRVLVLWGKKKLGFIEPHHPLIVQRPRDSGPLDLLLQADTFLPVQTRAYTFGDSKLSVKLTPVDQKKTLLGYRQEVPPDAADGGAPPAAVPPSAAQPLAPDAGSR